MISDDAPDASPYGPPPPPEPGLFGLPAGLLARAALAGLVAEVGFVVLMALLGLVSYVVLPGCEGDSCIGTPALWIDVLLSPVVMLVAFAGALTAFKLPRVVGVAAVAAGVAVVLLLGLVIGSFWLGLGGVVLALLAALAVTAGPVAAVAATALVDGRGGLRFVPVPAVVVGVVLVLVVAHLLTPFRQASKITDVVPQPYAYSAPDASLLVLQLNSYTQVLELEYTVGDDFVHVDEVGPVSAAARSADCSPALPLGEPTGLCRRVPGGPAGVTIWRNAVGASGTADPYTVVALPDATVSVFSATAADDAAVLEIVRRLVRTDARTLMRSAQSVTV